MSFLSSVIFSGLHSSFRLKRESETRVSRDASKPLPEPGQGNGVCVLPVGKKGTALTLFAAFAQMQRRAILRASGSQRESPKGMLWRRMGNVQLPWA
jgi:hypothetical protein